MKLYFFLKPFLLVMAFVSALFAATEKNLWENFDAKQQALLQGGKQLLITEEVPGTSWPFFHVYRLLAVAPLEAIAIFWDVQYAPHYIPDCLNASVEQVLKPNTIIVKYELRVPFFPKDCSQVRDEITELPGGGYKISWDVLHSTYSQSGQGSFIAIPHGAGTLMCYNNFINPGTAIASLLKKQAQNRVESTVAAIAHQIEYETQQSSEQLTKQLEQVKQALKKP